MEAEPRSAKKKRFVPKLQIGESHAQPDSMSNSDSTASSNFMMNLSGSNKKGLDSNLDNSVQSSASINTIPV